MIYFTAHTFKCVCHCIRTMFRVLGVYNFAPLTIHSAVCRLIIHTDRNNLVTLGIQVTQFLDLLFESTLVLVLSTENKTELTNW